MERNFFMGTGQKDEDWAGIKSRSVKFKRHSIKKNKNKIKGTAYGKDALIYCNL